VRNRGAAATGWYSGRAFWLVVMDGMYIASLEPVW
jgi:hypothetical protein